MTKANIHLIEDENLGGLLREYVESERLADEEDFIIHNFKDGGDRFFTDNKRYEVIHADRNGEITVIDDEGGEHILSFAYYKTLDPTDIILVEGTRYKLVDRKAEVGEKVIIVNTNEEIGTEKGDVISVNCIYACGLVDVPLGAVNPKNYLVLEPAESEITSDGGVKFSSGRDDVGVTVDESQASPEVIDMLGNLARRIVKLEAELDEYRALGLKERLDDGSSLFKRIYEEIDVLHSNQKRMAEEMANEKAEKVEVTTPTFDIDSAEVIVELAKLLARESRKVGRL